ncbi:hypothetical protein BDB00DRAFT_462610 [Zychaea mexicana]|uniref:uncharacterized protein n=1 Tax=Zychaea mexicana TaxID=64656 RepID=UPI0022FF3166|nr:uncharacterized protein BDB00DRAFT_462610 [Zychaea mexicana]KAI9491932.1 hypothetical protein BDB00DRAFT_462610 [Zychaea mexicana]
MNPTSSSTLTGYFHGTSGGSSDAQLCHRRRRRLNHNANERMRRSLLNAQYDALARALPVSPWNYNGRPSKRHIIEAALQWVYYTHSKEQQYHEELRRLQIENSRLVNEIQRRRV